MTRAVTESATGVSQGATQDQVSEALYKIFWRISSVSGDELLME